MSRPKYPRFWGLFRPLSDVDKLVYVKLSIKMLKIITGGLALSLLAGCGGPQVTAMQGPSGNAEYLVDCGHHGFDYGSWAQCYQKAAEACPRGYTVTDKNQEEGIGQTNWKRTLLVACKA